MQTTDANMYRKYMLAGREGAGGGGNGKSVLLLDFGQKSST